MSRARDAHRLTLAATSLGFAVVQLDVSVVNVAVRSIGSSLGGGLSGLQLIVSAYTVAFAACILTAGALSDRFGAKRLFIAGFALFTVASAACLALLPVGAGTAYFAMVVPVAAVGFGAGLVIPIITAELLSSVERSRAGIAAGTLNTLRQTGSAVGVALFGSLLTGGLVPGIHAALLVSVGLLSVVAGLAGGFRRGRSARPQPDFAG